MNLESLAPPTEFSDAKRDHWEQEKEKISIVLTERILRGRDEMAFSELKNTPVFRDKILTKVGEIALARLRNNARQIIKQEKPLVLQSKRRFDLDDIEIREELRRLRDLLAERLIFDRNELHAAVAFAVRLQFDLLTKPRATLEQLFYRQSPLRERNDIAVILQGLDENRPFVAGVQDLLNEYPEGPVTKEAFAALCRRAEREVYGRRPVPALTADLQAYQNFCSSIALSHLPRFDNQTALRMLRERGLNQLAESALPDLTQQEWWTIAEIEKLLETRFATTGMPLPPPNVFVPAEIASDKIIGDAAIQIERQLTETEFKDKKDPIEERPIESAPAAINFDDENKLENVMAVEAESPANGKDEDFIAAAQTLPLSLPGVEVDLAIPPDLLSPPVIEAVKDIEIAPPTATALAAPPKIIYRDTEAPRIIERAKLEAQPPGPYPSLSRLIDEKSRSALIKKIFRRDVEAYLIFIAQLEAIQTWKEAKFFLDKEFQARKINPYSKEAVHLSDLVFSRYFAKGTK